MKSNLRWVFLYTLFFGNYLPPPLRKTLLFYLFLCMISLNFIKEGRNLKKNRILAVALCVLFTHVNAQDTVQVEQLKQTINALKLELKQCKEAHVKNGDLNIAGKSYGGIVRSGPSMEHPRVASLKYMQKLIIVKKDTNKWNGYNWFKIKSLSGIVGYQWGGILCSDKNKQAGIYMVCE